jgi:hypothetical protein
MKYNRYRTFPSNTRSFNLDFLSAIGNGQIIVTFFTDEEPNNWKVWLMPYAEADWKEGNTKEDWKKWGREVLGLTGSWESFLALIEYPRTEFQKQVAYRLKMPNHMDIRLKPRRSNPFGVVIPDKVETADQIKRFLGRNVGGEHTGVSYWSEIASRGVREALCRKLSEDVDGCVLYIDQLDTSPIVLRKNNKADLVGGHTTLTEFVNAWKSMYPTELLQTMTSEDFKPNITGEWEEIHKRAEEVGFLREMGEELGLIRDVDIDFMDEGVQWAGYYGQKTGAEKPVWIYVDRSDPMIPIQIRMALAVDVHYN